MSNKKKPPVLAIVLVVIVLVTAGLAWAWWSNRHAADRAEPISGAVESNQYQVAASITGRVSEVTVAEGDKVAKDQVLVHLDSSSLGLQVTQAEEGVKAAKAAVAQERDKLNNDEDGASEAAVEAAQARVRQAEAAVDLAKTQQDNATIKAPHDGIVTSVTTNAGQNAAPGRPLLTLSDSQDLYVRVFVPEPKLGAVRIGQRARVAGPNGDVDGTVSYVATQAEFTPNNVNTLDQRTKLVYEVRVRISDASGELKPGMPVDVTF